MDKDAKIGEMMVKMGLIDDLQLQSALGHQKRWGGRLTKALVDLGFIEEETMLKFLAEQFKMKAVNLVRSRITPQNFAAVPENLARKYEVVPVVVRESGGKKNIILAMSDPSDLRAIDEIQFFTSAKVEPVLATASAIAKVLKHYGNYSPEMEKDFTGKETVTPAQLKREATRKGPPRPPPPPARPAPPPPPPEEDFDFDTADDLKVVKGEVTLIKAAKSAAKVASLEPPSRPVSPPFRTESPFLVKPEAPPEKKKAPEAKPALPPRPQMPPEAVKVSAPAAKVPPPEISAPPPGVHARTGNFRSGPPPPPPTPSCAAAR